MKTQPAKVRGFRPSPTNAERLDYAEKLGINVSKLIDDTLLEHLPTKLASEVRQKQQTLKKMLAAPMPA